MSTKHQTKLSKAGEQFVVNQNMDRLDGSLQLGNLRFEKWAAQVEQLLPGVTVERTSEVIQLTTGDFRDELGLVILLSPEAIELRLPTLIWDGPHTPIKTSRLWQRLALDDLKESQLPRLMAEAQTQQQQSFCDCKYCGQRNPKSWMHSPDVCQSCAEKELGVVH